MSTVSMLLANHEKIAAENLDIADSIFLKFYLD